MPNQKLRKCRFYANMGEYFHTNKMLFGGSLEKNKIFSRPTKISVWGDFDSGGFDQTATVSNKETGTIRIGNYSGGAHTGNRLAPFFRENRFIAILNHNFWKANAKFYIQTYLSGYSGGNYSQGRDMVEIINGSISSKVCTPTADGFTICEILDGFDENHNSISIVLEAETGSTFSVTPGIGCVILGTWWDIDYPDLTISASRVYDKPKEQKNYSGRSFTNSKWYAPAFWDFLPPWGLRKKDNAFIGRGRQGKRVYKLQWSFLDEKNIWGITASDSIYTGNSASRLSSAGYDLSEYDTSSGEFDKDSTLLGYKSFYNFWTRTAGMTIPFIFQADSSYNAPDQFSICILKKGSLKIARTSFKRYNISMEIQEI